MNECGTRMLPEIEFVGGGAQEYLFHSYFSQNGRPFDLDGCTANFAVTPILNRYGAPVISKEMTVVNGDGETGQTNLLLVVLDPEDTVEMYIRNNINKKFVMQP